MMMEDKKAYEQKFHGITVKYCLFHFGSFFLKILLNMALKLSILKTLNFNNSLKDSFSEPLTKKIWV